MMSRCLPLLAVSLLLGILAPAANADEPRERIPILLDTDIGDDVDDAFALALVLTSPELELRGVTTVAGPASTRATLVCRFLDAVGRPGVPVAAGESTRPPKNEGMLQYGLRASPKSVEKASAVEFMYRQLKADPGKITVVAIGPLTNVAALLEKHPDAKPWIKRIVLMGGAIRVGYEGKPPAEPEWNIKSDVAAARAVFASGVPLLVAPLDATVSVKLTAERRNQLFATDSLLCKHVQALYELWGKETPVLYDPVAVALLLDESFCDLEKLRLEVADDGTTRVVEGKPNARVATRIRADAFLGWYGERVVHPPLVAEQLPQELFFTVLPEAKYRFLGYPVNLDTLKSFLVAIANERKRVIKLEGAKAALEAGGSKAIIRAKAEASYVDVIKLVDLVDGTLGEVSLKTLSDEPANVSELVPRRGLPSRVHVFEDYDSKIERRWWLSGLPVKDDSGKRLRGRVGSVCRAMLCRNFDRKMGDRFAIHRAVIFNPVPGPPMGPNTRLSFRYKLHGTDQVRVQIYSLTNGYHRYLTLTDLPQDEWREATVDMTAARRPDGSGGPLSEDERIDDIQFYIEPNGELLIDDVVLYDEAAEEETKPFPARLLFTGWFDTGKQGVEWPGKFEIVPHEAPGKWKAAKSIPGDDGGPPQLRVSLRGPRQLSDNFHLRFRYRLSGGDKLGIALASEGKEILSTSREDPTTGEWTETEFRFHPPGSLKPQFTDEIRFVIPPGEELLIDDLLLYDPGKSSE